MKSYGAFESTQPKPSELENRLSEALGLESSALAYDELCRLAQAESSLMASFSRMLLRPNRELARDLKKRKCSSEMVLLLPVGSSPIVDKGMLDFVSFEESIQDLSLEEVRIMLELEYNRLFVGPHALLAPPYESFYTSDRADSSRGRLRMPVEREVSAFYRSFGFQMPDVFVELPDHIAIELEFLSLMIGREATAWETENIEQASVLQDACNRFIDEHLGRWISCFTEQLNGTARLPLYPTVATMAKGVISLLHG